MPLNRFTSPSRISIQCCPGRSIQDVPLKMWRDVPLETEHHLENPRRSLGRHAHQVDEFGLSYEKTCIAEGVAFLGMLMWANVWHVIGTT